jgi:hypothetical protein
MATTVAAIAAEAFDGVAAELSGVILSCTVTTQAQGVYNATTGTYTETPTAYTGRALMDQSTPIKDIFPEYVAGPEDALFWLEGLSAAPKENDVLAIGGVDRTIRRVGDVVGVGTFFSVVAR